MGEKWKIDYYQSSMQTTSRVYDFINRLDPAAKAKVINLLDLLEEYGISLRTEHVKKVVGTDLWELRILGQNNIRIFYVTMTGKSFLLLHAFLKKKQKTDSKEIRVALDRLREYRSR